MELFEACSRRSCEQVELLLAARFPKPDVRDSICRLPIRSVVRDSVAPDVGSAQHAELSNEQSPSADLPSARLPSAEAPSAAAPSAAAPSVSNPISAIASPPMLERAQIPRETAVEASHAGDRGRVEPLSAERFGVHFTADVEFRELLEEVRALVSHGQPKGELLPIMKGALRAYRSELQKRRFGVGRKPRDGADAGDSVRNAAKGSQREPASVARVGVSAGNAARRSRHVSAKVARAVYERDGGCCSFCSDDGRRCGARRFLALDHIQPWAAGGESTVGNLRLRCRAHNLLTARIHFGAEQIRKAVARGRGASWKESGVG